jgi:hypothetical protein
MLHKQQVWTNSEILTYRPFPTMQRERKERNNTKAITHSNKSNNKYTLSSDNLTIYTGYQCEGYEVIEVDMYI